MSSQLALLACTLFILFNLVRDVKRREDVSKAIWIPTLWVAILCSRPVSVWLSGGIASSAGSSLDGSPIDRTVYLGLIISGFIVLSRRQIKWNEFISNNKGVLLLYLYLLITVLWSAHPFVAFKRWFKDFGNIIILLVILTESSPPAAFRAVFVRCAYVLIPLSVVYIKWFPHLGRAYGRWSGEMMATGVTLQKNSLGAMLLVCGLPFVWQFLIRKKEPWGAPTKTDFGIYISMLLMGAWLLIVSNSQTSLVCMLIGLSIILTIKFPAVKQHAARFGGIVIAVTLLFLLLDSTFNLKENLLEMLGRDATLTGRTDVWAAVLDQDTDPMFGVGFCSFWSDERYVDSIPDWLMFSSHNGYLEIYLDGGLVGDFFLILMLAIVFGKITKDMARGEDFSIVRFAFLLITIVYNFSEAIYGRLSPGWFIFLLIAIEYPRPQLEFRVEGSSADSLSKERVVSI